MGKSEKHHEKLDGDLIIAPKTCIEHVIVHELCHLKEHNHGPAFYRLLKALMPDWEQRRERLNGWWWNNNQEDSQRQCESPV